MNGKITIKEIAEHCGVSMATVSRAINGSSYVSATLGRKIREYIEDVGWKSNSLSTKLQSEMNAEIVVVASMNLLERTEKAQELKMLLEELYRAGFNPVVRLGHRSESLRKCLKNRSPLVVLYGVSDRLYGDVKQLMEAGTRIIGIGEAYTHPCPLVMSDHRSAAREAAETLRRNGARKVALFAGMGAQPHPESLEKIYSRSAKIIQGIQDVFPGFDYRKDAVSDSFGDLSELKNMLASGLYDGWILGSSGRMDEMIALEGPVSVMEKRTVLLLENPACPVPPVCIRIFAENTLARVRKLAELIQKPFAEGNEEHLVPYLGLNSKKQRKGDT